MKQYSNEELSVIARALNTLSADSDKTKGVTLNTFHVTRFANKEYYIDYNIRTQKYGVYARFKTMTFVKEDFNN